MGLATIDPHSLKVQTKLYKIPKIGVNRPKSKQNTAIWKCQNLQRFLNVWPSISGCHTFFVNFDVFKSLYLSQMWISVCSFRLCGSLVANPIIYRLVPSPSRFEIRQWAFYPISSPEFSGFSVSGGELWARDCVLPENLRYFHRSVGGGTIPPLLLPPPPPPPARTPIWSGPISLASLLFLFLADYILIWSHGQFLEFKN